MENEFVRTEMLIGAKALKKLQNCRVAVFGVGGVGGYVVEALARSGIGELDLIDNDTISITNINRQIIALQSTIGKDKVEIAQQRVLDINPKCKVNIYKTFFTPETSSEFEFSKYNYVVDAIDSVTGKIELVIKSNEANVPIISSMGAGNKLDPTAFKISDISKTNVCPLARVMRRELKALGINHLKVCYSEEIPLSPLPSKEDRGKRVTPGSTAFCPSVMGLIIGGEIVKDLIK